jgi:serine/threonine-protein phosphatase PP1 catalytic subunit
LPLAVLVNDKLFACHGGLSAHLNKIEEINNIKRPVEIEKEGLLCDLVWSDPNKDGDGWAPSDRGVSVKFGQDIVENFLRNNNLSLMVRSHSVSDIILFENLKKDSISIFMSLYIIDCILFKLAMDGYEMFANNKLITVFSAENYCGKCNNKAAFGKFNKDLSYEIITSDGQVVFKNK